MHRGGRNEAGKLFIGGLSWDTDQDSLLDYFSQYGEVIDCVVMKNQQTGKSRGFGFVTFKDPQCVDTVLTVPAHIIDGRKVDAKACNPKGINKGPKGGGHEVGGERRGGGGGGGGGMDPAKDRKIFMGGLPNVDEDFLKNFFGRYGKVLDVTIMVDQHNKKSRGFGFLSFENEESVERVCAEHYITINGKKVECKPAQPRDGKQQPIGGGGGRGHPQLILEMGGMPPQQEGNWGPGGGNWNQGPPPPQQGPPPPGPGPVQNNMGFPPGQGGYQQPGYGQQQPPPQQPPVQPPFTQAGYQPGYQGQPGYQQGGWNPQPNASPGQQAEVPNYSAYGGQPPQGAYGQQPAPANTYNQWGSTPTTPATPQPPPATAQQPQQPPAQPGYGTYGQPTPAAPAAPAYAAPGQPPQSPQTAVPPRPYGDYPVPVGEPGQPSAQPPPAPASAYSAYNPYSAPQAPVGVPDPYAQQPAAQPAAAPGFNSIEGYAAVPQASTAPPTDPAAAQPKPAEYATYNYGAYGYGDGAGGFGAVPQPAPAYTGQGDGQQPAYAAQPGGGYTRASAPATQAYHPYRR